MYKIVFTKQAAKDARNLKVSGLDKKAKSLLEIMREDPFTNPPAYKALVGNLAGLYSRRINLQHRIVYQVLSEPIIETGIQYKGIIKIIRMWTHYENV